MTILELLKENGIPVKTHGEHHHVTSNWTGVDCPFCSPRSNSFRMGISLNGLAVSCWTCGRKGVYATLKELIGAEKASEFCRNRTPDKGPEERRTGILKMPEPSYENMPDVFQRYLAGRGIRDLDYYRKIWGLRAITIHPTHNWRLLIPIHLNGEVVSWTTRTIGKGKSDRYRSAAPDEEVISHKRLLYGEDYCRHACIVTEGPMDVMRGGPGFVATFGTAWTMSQALRIAKYPVRVIAFDNEPEAQASARRLADLLSCHPGETYVAEIKTGKDLGDCKMSEIREIRRRFLE